MVKCTVLLLVQVRTFFPIVIKVLLVKLSDCQKVIKKLQLVSLFSLRHMKIIYIAYHFIHKYFFFFVTYFFSVIDVFYVKIVMLFSFPCNKDILLCNFTLTMLKQLCRKLLTRSIIQVLLRFGNLKMLAIKIRYNS